MWSRKKYSPNMDAKAFIENSFNDIWRELRRIKITAIMVVIAVIMKKLIKKNQ